MEKKVLLFDLDGVLVRPLGYRASVRAALGYFLSRMGLLPDREDQHSSLLPDEEVMALFESQGITNEWDMVPISLAILLEALLTCNPGLSLPGSLLETCTYLRSLDHPPVKIPQQVEWRLSILALGSRLPGEPPAETALRLAQAPGQALFPNLAGHPLLIDLLGRTRQVLDSPTTRLFQHFSLGSRAFSLTYRVPADLESPSLLEANDRPLISAGLRAELIRQVDRGQVFAAALTARPSLPPKEITDISAGYSPEAEMALKLLGLERMPLIAYGRLFYFAELEHTSPEQLLKPSPVQALAAVFAALTGQELASLQLAYTLHQMGEKEGPGPGSLPVAGPLCMHVFEDASGGIRAGRAAAEVLNRAGLACRLEAWGVASSPDKVQSLEMAGAKVLPNVNEALSIVLAG